MSAEPQTVSTLSSRLLSLPDEILIEILRFLLQQTGIVAVEGIGVRMGWRYDAFLDEFPGPVLSDKVAKEGHRISVRVLRVCRRLYALGIPLLYGNVILFNVLTSPADQSEKEMQLFARAKRDRQGNGLLGKLVLFINTPYVSGPRDRTIKAAARSVRRYANVLAAYRMCWEKVFVHVVDWSTQNSYSTDERTALMLLSGLGAMRATEVKLSGVLENLAGELERCMKLPGRVKPSLPGIEVPDMDID